MKSFITALALAAVLAGCTPAGNPNHYACNSIADIDAYFTIDPDNIIISGHRGGNMPGYPENCIETFDKILETMPAFYEIDPRLTKDSVIVLMHDPTLDRTTTGKGKANEYTYAELQKLNLVDKWGNVTPYKIPLVEDVVKWSQGKTILNFDLKDVPREMLVPFVNSLGAHNCIYTVQTPEQALVVLKADSNARMSCWVRNMEHLKAYDEAGVPSENMALAYVVSDIMKESNAELYAELRNRGIPCMVSTCPKQDRAKTEELRRPLWKEVLDSRPDIIETDYPLELNRLYGEEK